MEEAEERADIAEILVNKLRAKSRDIGRQVSSRAAEKDPSYSTSATKISAQTPGSGLFPTFALDCHHEGRTELALVQNQCFLKILLVPPKIHVYTTYNLL